MLVHKSLQRINNKHYIRVVYDLSTTNGEPMKLALLFISAFLVSHAVFLHASDFNSRWGANSMIANMPLFFIPREDHPVSRTYSMHRTGNSIRKHYNSVTTKSYSSKSAIVANPVPAKSNPQTVTVIVDNLPEKAPQPETITLKTEEPFVHDQLKVLKDRQATLDALKKKLQSELAGI